MRPTLETLRRFAVARSLFTPTSLERAMDRFGFVQADPIRAPARAQDLTLRHRVVGYRAGDLERLYSTLAVEEDTFINYGFVTHAVSALMHPRGAMRPWTPAERRKAQYLLGFIRELGVAHPRDVARQFAPRAVTNDWGGSSQASTYLLDTMHYRGLLRIAGRQDGVRTYAVRKPSPKALDPTDRNRRIDRLVDVVVRKYAPLPARSLATVVRRLRYAAPQWHGHLGPALERARTRLVRVTVDGVDWFWHPNEPLEPLPTPDGVRLLTPFDPVVWDRERFERLWGWEYRFEAYTPVAERQRGYYALPLLWRDQVIGWANVIVKQGVVEADFGFANPRPPREREFKTALEEEIERLRSFLSRSTDPSASTTATGLYGKTRSSRVQTPARPAD